MEATTNPNNTNTFPNSLPLHIYKSILLFRHIKREILILLFFDGKISQN